MYVDFLYASNGTPISKTFTHTANGIDETPYPRVRELTSQRVNVASAKEFSDALIHHSKRGAALLKGLLDRPLHNESRAEHTDPYATTEWLCLDLDFSEGFNSLEHFLYEIDASLTSVSYIWQYSASSGITNPIGLRGHLFILLDKPVLPATIKSWLKSLNFRIEPLKERITLAPNGLALKYPLDISTCENGKALFTPPPILNGIADPLGDDRYLYVQKVTDCASIDFITDTANINAVAEDHVTTLRKQAGLRKRTAKYTTLHNIEVMKNPEQATVTGIKEERGFVYLNLNHGDSWGYYFPKDNPNLLFNFKEEPVVRLKDIAPQVYSQYRVDRVVIDPEIQPYVFRDMHEDTYYTALWDKANNALELFTVSNMKKCQDFLMQRGQPIPDVIEDWRVEFDPRINIPIRPDERWANRFIPSKYMNTDYPTSQPVPATIERVFRSLFSDNETYHWHMNWIAYIFQYRDKSMTAWILQGCPGTGKGVYFANILRPLFGHNYVVPLTPHNLEEKYNTFALGSLINFFDEFHLGNDKTALEVINRLKNLITERYVNIRKMQTDPTPHRVFNNVVAATNYEGHIALEEGDRRFNVTPYQNEKLDLNDEDILAIETELDDLAAHLQHYEVNVRQAQRVLENKARADLIKVSLNTVDSFFKALRDGDLDYFIQYLDGETRKTGGMPDLDYNEYRNIIRGLVSTRGQSVRITRDELISLYKYLQQKDISSTKFTRMATIHRLEIKPMRVDNELKRGITVTFKTEQPIAPPTNNVTSITDAAIRGSHAPRTGDTVCDADKPQNVGDSH